MLIVKMGTEELRPISNEDAYGVCAARDPATKNFMLQHTMFRIKDPLVSLKFYTEVLGMTLLVKVDFYDAKFTLYFMGFVDDLSEIPKEFKEREKWATSRSPTIELTHNWGTENDPNYKYVSGNDEPLRGYGHIAFAVHDVYEVCDRFEKMGVKFQKTPKGGRMKGFAYIKDPDGYWIEIMNPNALP